MHRITVIGGGFAGLTASIAAAESGADVRLYEAHQTLGGRARTSDGPYRTNDGPHALYRRGPHWDWLRRRDLIGPLAAIPPREGVRFRFRRGGALRKVPPLAMVRLAYGNRGRAPVGCDFLSWASDRVGVEGARAAARYTGVALFHHDPGSLSAAFVQERLRRATSLPPEASYPRGGWGQVIERMVDRARRLGVRIESGSRVDVLPEREGPVIVATSLDAARGLLKDDSLRWPSGRTTLIDLVLSAHREDPFILSDLDAPGWLERFTAQDPSLAPAGYSLIQGQLPIAPKESKADGVTHAEDLLDLGFPHWRERTVWRRESLAQGRTGAVDAPGTTWRDRPAIDRGGGVYLVGDQVAAPGVLSEVSFTSALSAVSLVSQRAPGPTGSQIH
ncbi:NAD(P)-binding protein [Streptomyces albipurpureus]|uniref:NAD(P)-binding protein n=1 Tax=Streptomyces albipurpureus TaxID=2897419 RepID=A0ABT0V0F2_9ACTN|nr:NAD(P)-binding protein [Streptomyces sp. CWNU-1]MCM2394215.1 NAD(P)-binding protein [Streptomyces sp. CWNU-1]